MNPADPQKNILMLKLPRTGSTYLAHLLGTHDDIEFTHEYLNKFKTENAGVRRGLGRLPLIRSIRIARLKSTKCSDIASYLTKSSKCRYVGASLNPFKDGFDISHLQHIVNDETRIIVLTRTNLLKQQISHLNVLAERKAGTERPYKSYNADKRATSRTFFIGKDSIDAIRDLAETRSRFLKMVNALGAPKLFLTYEEHVNTPDKRQTFSALSNFLDMPESPLWTADESDKKRDQHFHKLVSDDLESVVENYDEIAANEVTREFL